MKQINAHEGYETFVNSFRMTLKMCVHLIIATVFVHVLITIGLIYFSTDLYDLKVTLYWIFAKAISSLNLGLKMTFQNPDGTMIQTSPDIIANTVTIKEYAFACLYEMKKIFVFSSTTYLLFPVFIIFFKYWSKRSGKYIRGSKLISLSDLLKEMAKRKEISDLPFGQTNMPVAGETKSTLMIGSPGVGKTTLIAQIFHRLRERNERSIIHDSKGDYVEKFYDPNRGDMIFNPLDKRSLGWTIFNELITFTDIDAVASSLIPPSSSGTDPFWTDAARDLFSGISHFLYQNNFRTNRDVWKLLTSDGQIIADNLNESKGGERGFRYIEDPKSKQALSVFSVMMQHCRCFEFMAGNEGSFSISDWIEKGTGCIFITNNSEVQDTLRPILSLFIDLLARKLLSLPDTTTKKTFFLLDEFGTLQRLPSILKLLTMGRSKGACCYIGIQDFGQIDKIYSKEHRQTIINSCGNKVIFSVTDTNTAKYCSELIGETEYLYSDKTLSMGESNLRNKASLSFRKRREALFLPSTIMNFPELQCIVKFWNYSPVVSKLIYKNFSKMTESFLIRDDLLLKNM